MAISKPFDKVDSLDKAHGRLEIRQGTFYDVSGVKFDKIWKSCQLSTLVVLNRQSTNLKTKKIAQEKSFYLFNSPKSKVKTQTYFNAYEIINK